MQNFKSVSDHFTALRNKRLKRMRYLQRDSIPQPLRSGQTGLFKTIELRLEYLSV